MLSLLVALAVGYAALIALLYGFQRSIIYKPDTTRPVPADFGVPEMKPVALTTADGLRIEAWWRPPVGAAEPVMLYLHGNGGHIGHRGEKMRPYLQRGWGVMLLSWRGYGGNPGNPSEEGFYADAEAALAFLRRNAVDTETRLVIYGESLGTGPAVKLASENELSSLVLQSPFTGLGDLAQRMFPYLPARYFVRDRFPSIDRIGDVQAPVFILHGESDRTVPVSHGRRLLEAASGIKKGLFLAGAGHNDLGRFNISIPITDFILANLNTNLR